MLDSISHTPYVAQFLLFLIGIHLGFWTVCYRKKMKRACSWFFLALLELANTSKYLDLAVGQQDYITYENVKKNLLVFFWKAKATRTYR